MYVHIHTYVPGYLPIQWNERTSCFRFFVSRTISKHPVSVAAASPPSDQLCMYQRLSTPALGRWVIVPTYLPSNRQPRYIVRIQRRMPFQRVPSSPALTRSHPRPPFIITAPTDVAQIPAPYSVDNNRLSRPVTEPNPLTPYTDTCSKSTTLGR
ncbi:hypothetical protein LX32DRAFT_332286 [Colletotrichum zoysiae]|uniref:Uncharacterized protein n=1 Tax=Colletotrichum zoysiae TaxID=1216348 RepID=A0AAD9M6F9_9PEZI|nr:hypothetical protein LX32DRAFT_332286 [Colletotrichum zoysiae]